MSVVGVVFTVWLDRDAPGHTAHMGMRGVNTAVDYGDGDAASRAATNRRMVRPDLMPDGRRAGHAGQACALACSTADASMSRRKSR
jgi:hypothetical protein